MPHVKRIVEAPIVAHSVIRDIAEQLQADIDIKSLFLSHSSEPVMAEAYNAVLGINNLGRQFRLVHPGQPHDVQNLCPDLAGIIRLFRVLVGFQLFVPLLQEPPARVEAIDDGIGAVSICIRIFQIFLGLTRCASDARMVHRDGERHACIRDRGRCHGRTVIKPKLRRISLNDSVIFLPFKSEVGRV